MQTSRSILNISVPKALEKEITLLAKQENKTKSELIREAFRSYRFIRDWAKIRAWGQQAADRFGLESYDDIEEFLG